MSYSDLSHRIKCRIAWDKILLLPTPRIVREGYRINISGEEEEEINKAKEILKEAQILFEDRKATSFSDSVRPGDRTLRVLQPRSVTKLRMFWTEEVQKKKYVRQMKKQKGDR